MAAPWRLPSRRKLRPISRAVGWARCAGVPVCVFEVDGKAEVFLWAVLRGDATDCPGARRCRKSRYIVVRAPIEHEPAAPALLVDRLAPTDVRGQGIRAAERGVVAPGNGKAGVVITTGAAPAELAAAGVLATLRDAAAVAAVG